MSMKAVGGRWRTLLVAACVVGLGACADSGSKDSNGKPGPGNHVGPGKSNGNGDGNGDGKGGDDGNGDGDGKNKPPPIVVKPHKPGDGNGDGNGGSGGKDGKEPKSAEWCVTPILPGPCAAFPENRRETTLSAVIDAPAAPGDTVIVYPGTYTDQPNITIPGLIVFSAEGPDDTIFDGRWSPFPALRVSVGGVVLDGFTFTHSEGGVGGGLLVSIPSPTPVSCHFAKPLSYGEELISHCSQAVEGDFTLKNSWAIGNWSPDSCGGEWSTCYGAKILATGDVKIVDVKASYNGSGDYCGLGIDMINGVGVQSLALPSTAESCFGILAYSTESDVRLERVDASENRAGDGCFGVRSCFGALVDSTAGDVKFEDVNATSNGADYECGGSDSCFGIGAFEVHGHVAMKNVRAEFNGARYDCASAIAEASVLGGDYEFGTFCDGIIVNGPYFGKGGLSIGHAIASNNGAFNGNCFDGQGESCSGIVIEDRGGDIRLEYVEASGNGAFYDCEGDEICNGIQLDSFFLLGDVKFEDVLANNNGARGACYGEDSCNGIYFEGEFCSGTLDVKKVWASYNGAGNSCYASDSCAGILVDSAQNTGSYHFAQVTTDRNGAGYDCDTSGNSCLGLFVDEGGVDPDPEPVLFAEGENGLNGLNGIDHCPALKHKGSKDPKHAKWAQYTFTGHELRASFNGAGEDCVFGNEQCLGILVEDQFGDVTVTNASAVQNGAYFTCDADDSCFGFMVEASIGSVKLEHVEGSRNGSGGECSYEDSCFGIWAETDGVPGDVTLRQTRSIANRNDGTVVVYTGDLLLFDIVSFDNGDENVVTEPQAL